MTPRTPPSDNIVIIGAGPAGLTAAYELVRHGYRPVVLEKDPHYVGGLARTVEYKRFRFDIGGHRFFSKSEEIERLWEEICGDDFLRRARRSRILYRGKFFDYPLRAGNVLRSLGLLESTACILSYLKHQAFPVQPEVSFEDWVVNRFGRRLFEIFFRTYTEKVWGMPCREISADWASQRIKGLSLKEAVIDAFLPKGRLKAGQAVKTLIDSFRYPRLGPGMMWEKARDGIISAGGQVAMGRRVTMIGHDELRVTGVEVQCEDGRKEFFPATHLISSMPLREFLQCWRPAPPEEVLSAAGGLKYRDFMIAALIVRQPEIFPDNWIYVHDPSVRVGRIQNFRAWSPDMVPNPEFTCLGLEYFCSEHDELWSMPNADLVALAAGELERIGLVGRSAVEDGCVMRVRQTYPVYDGSYQDHVRMIRRYLEQFANVQVVGRNGMHKYNNQDHSMMTALLAARNVMGGQFDLWKVNTDAEYLEEEPSPLTASRLVPRPLPANTRPLPVTPALAGSAADDAR